MVHRPPRKEVRLAFSDYSVCEEIFSPVPQTRLEDGLSRMAAWVKRVGSRKSEEFKEIEIPQGLPPSWLSGEEEESPLSHQSAP